MSTFDVTSDDSLDQLRSLLRGPVHRPHDDGYAATVHTHVVPANPDVAVRPADADDVLATLRWAVEAGLSVAVRGGGHGEFGSIPGGVLINMRGFDRIEVVDDLVRVGAGLTWGEVTAELEPRGLYISAGDSAPVGVAGNTLGGGFGWMVRSWGLALDQLVAAEVATVDGRVVTASATENPDLFWALRGGGGNFGVVLRFDYRAHRLPGIVFGTISLEGTDLAASLRGWRDVMRRAPRALSSGVLGMPFDLPELPSRLSIVVCWAGADGAEARAAIAPLLAIPGVVAADIGARRYADALLRPPDVELPAPQRPAIHSGSALFDELSDAAIDVVVAAGRQRPVAILVMRWLGGAYGDVPPEATAFPFRAAEALVSSAALTGPGGPAAEVAALAAAWAPVTAIADGCYGNFASPDPATVARMYPAATLARLGRVKREWDPANVLRRNHNVPPGPG